MKRILATLAALSFVTVSVGATVPAVSAAPAALAVRAVEATFGDQGVVTRTRSLPMQAHARAAGAAVELAPPSAAATARTVGLLEAGPGPMVASCAASVVPSTYQVLIITAAHCVHSGDGLDNWITPIHFIPGYVKGAPFPYGRFKASAAITYEKWATEGDYDYDIAFIVLRPNDDGVAVGKIVGNNGLTINAPPVADRTIVSYENQVQAQCSGTTMMAPTWPYSLRVWMVGCPSPSNEGNSGSPFLADFDGRAGYVNGVISTGSSAIPYVSSPYFDSSVESIWLEIKDHPGV